MFKKIAFILLLLIPISSKSELLYSTFFGGNDRDFVTDIEFVEGRGIYICGYTFSADLPTTLDAYQRDIIVNEVQKPDAFFAILSESGDSLIYCSYLGGASDDYAMDIEVDSQGRIYVAGHTFPFQSFPSTEDAYAPFQAGGYDGFISIFDPTGRELIYSTFLPSNKDDYILDIELDSQGRIYAVGYTGISSNFPVTNDAYQTQPSGNFDGFLTVLSSDWKRLEYSTLIGGNERDFIQDISISDNGNIYLAGITASPNLRLSPNAAQREINNDSTNNSEDAFICIFDANYRLSYLSYWGGSGDDKAYSIKHLENNDFAIAGYTESVDFQTSTNAFDRILNKNVSTEGVGDCFITVFRNNSMLYSTYYGSDGTDRAFSLEYDGDFLYISGNTNSVDLPITSLGEDKTFNSIGGVADAFFAKFDKQLSKLNYSTYLGGFHIDVAASLAIVGDRAWITGWTESYNFPYTSNAIDTTFNASLLADVYISSFNHVVAGIDLGFDRTICLGDTVSIEMIVNLVTLDSVYWEPNYAVEQISLVEYRFSPDTTVIYTFYGITDENDTLATELKINVLPFPIAEIAGSIIVHADSITVYQSSQPEVNNFWSIKNGTILEQPENFQIVARFDSTDYGSISLISDNTVCRDSTLLDIYIAYSLNRTNLSLVSGLLEPCLGEEVVLDAGEGYDEYIWNTGTKSRFDTIRSSGIYYAAVRMNDDRFGISDTIEISYRAIPDSELFGADTVSPNSTEIYYTQLNSNYSYSWQIVGANSSITNSTNDSITVNWGTATSGTIILNVTNELGCDVSIVKNILIGRFDEPTILVQGGGTSFCEGDVVTLDAGAGFSAYLWSNGTSSRFTSVTTSQDVWVAGTGADGVVRYSDTIPIVFNPRPPKPDISHTGNLIRCLSVGTAYQWFRNSQAISGSIGRIFRVEDDGWYKVMIFNEFGCGTFSDSVFVSITSVNHRNEGLLIYPNPAYDFIELQISEIALESEFIIYNIFGQIMHEGKFSSSKNKLIDLKNYPSGTYFLRTNNIIYKFIKL